MKKLNLDNKEKIFSVKKATIDKQLIKILNETLQVVIKSEPNTVLGIDGKETFIESIKDLIANYKTNTREKTLESLKPMLFNFNQNTLNESIKNITKLVESSESFPLPTDIFSQEDYEDSDGDITLHSLENIPEDYLTYLNERDIEKYFYGSVWNGFIDIKYDNEGWALDFYGVEKLENSETAMIEEIESIDYEAFIKTNKDFIHDFIIATSKLIGHNRLALAPRLKNIL